jgi:hypothetical protein
MQCLNLEMNLIKAIEKYFIFKMIDISNYICGITKSLEN